MRKFFTLHSAVHHPTFYPVIVTILLALVVAGCNSAPAPSVTPTSVSTGTSLATPVALPHFDHVVVVMEENHGYADIIGSDDAPYINSLATQGALFTNSHAITHPSEPNYLALFAGSTLGVTNDACPINGLARDLGGEVIAKGQTFTGYSESLPSVGFTGCTSGDGLYARKHSPWVNFIDVPASDNQPFTSFPTDFTKLPTVAFVIPNLQDDMHNGTVEQGDSWLKGHLDGYIQWAKTHNSLLMLTWDEDEGSDVNQIATIFVGAHVKAGRYGETINHYSVLSTIEDVYGLPYTRSASAGMAIKDVWQ